MSAVLIAGGGIHVYALIHVSCFVDPYRLAQDHKFSQQRFLRQFPRAVSWKMVEAPSLARTRFCPYLAPPLESLKQIQESHGLLLMTMITVVPHV